MMAISDEQDYSYDGNDARRAEARQRTRFVADRRDDRGENNVDDNDCGSQHQRDLRRRKTACLSNFLLMSVLFSANHGCVVSCLALATTRLGGRVGAYQGGVLYASYTSSALLGATYVVKTLGARNALVTGMGAYVAYVSCFWFAAATNTAATAAAYASSSDGGTAADDASVLLDWRGVVAALLGAAIGGAGAGFLWVAQGAYFARAAEEHSELTAAIIAQEEEDDEQQQEVVQGEERRDAMTTRNTSTERFSSYFAFVYLSEEVALRSLSTLLLERLGWTWSAVFATYALVAVVSTGLMAAFVRNYDDHSGEHDVIDDEELSGEVPEEGNGAVTISRSPSNSVFWYKATAAARLLRRDPKMKYMIGLNAAFGFASAFLNSYVNAEVVPIVFGSTTNNSSDNNHSAIIFNYGDSGDDNNSGSDGSKYIGILTSWVSIVAATMSLVFGRISPKVGNGPVLIAGAMCFFFVAAPFLALPRIELWGWTLLVAVYTCHGVGRATFEGALRATFAEYFAYEKEGAYANIILQNGLSSAVGYVLTFGLSCSKDRSSPYCVEYRDGSFHDVLTFELLVVLSAVAAVFGFWRASALYNNSSSYQPLLSSSSSTSSAALVQNEDEPEVSR